MRKLYNDIMDKIWKTIKGYEGLYRVSNYGEIYSFGRIVNTKIKYVTKVGIIEQVTLNGVRINKIWYMQKKMD